MAYLLPADLRGVDGMDDVNKPTDAQLEDYIAEFERIAERYIGVAFEPRTVTETLYLPAHSHHIKLTHPKIRSVTSVTHDGTAIAADTYDVLTRSSHLLRSAGWDEGTVVVTYSHGFDAPDESLKRACRNYVTAAFRQDTSGSSRDVISTNVGDQTFRYSTPDWDKGRPTGYLDVDRALNSFDRYKSVPVV